MPEAPVAYFITFATYGARLHGDARGSVDRGHNRPGTPVLGYDERLWEAERAQLKGQPVTLGASERRVVAEAIRGVVHHRKWRLHALNIRTNHVHVVVSGTIEPEPMMTAFKGWATRRLREKGLISPMGEVWGGHGSTRWIWSEEGLADVIDYVHFGQGDWLAGCGAPERAPEGSRAPTNPRVGLCSDCRFGRRIANTRGSTFWLCEAAAHDRELPKYPQLPVRRCSAFDRESAGPGA